MPVVNALTDGFHPCQLLADLLTSASGCGGTAGRALAYVGDAANNMAHSYLLGRRHRRDARTGRRPGRLPARPDGGGRAPPRSPPATGGSVAVLGDPVAAVDGADVVATDTWTSMGQESDGRDRHTVPARTRSTTPCWRAPPATCVVLHCLPAHRGEEITDEVFDGAAERGLGRG